jgi:hypothetical protein
MNPRRHTDDPLGGLGDLGPIDPPPELADRVRRQAQAELRATSERGWWTVATTAWTRVGLPAALAVTVVAYLSWAVTSASALYR